MHFNSVCVAGTFDHLHLGHQKLLEIAKASGKKVMVGLCQKSMLINKAYPESLENYSVRRQAVNQFNPDQIIPLSDIYGPASTDPKLEAIICTPETQTNVNKINQVRQKNRLPQLAKILVNLIKDSSGQILSSTRIRQGLVSRQGLSYFSLFSKNLSLSKKNRVLFQKPFGQILSTIIPPKYNCITVGDIATISLIKANFTPNLAIVDLKTKRQPTFPDLASLGLKSGLTAINPPSTITRELVTKIFSCLSQKIPTLLVDGEEDLAVLPAILLSPLKTTIYYGQPDVGLVKIIVTEKTKAKAVKLLGQLE